MLSREARRSTSKLGALCLKLFIEFTLITVASLWMAVSREATRRAAEMSNLGLGRVKTWNP
jgi:hypothetical protein